MAAQLSLPPAQEVRKIWQGVSEPQGRPGVQLSAHDPFWQDRLLPHVTPLPHRLSAQSTWPLQSSSTPLLQFSAATHLPLHLRPVSHSKSQAPFAHVALPPAGAEQGMQEVPQLLTFVSDTQLLLQLCLPAGHCPSHGLSTPMQAPRQSLVPFGQDEPQLIPSQVADPPVGVGHAVQETPQVATLLSSTQVSPHR
jgi:hypothetical protein